MSGSVPASATAPGIIQFAEIPYTLKVPGEYMEVKPAVNANAVLPFPARGLIMGQMFSTGVLGEPGKVYNISSTSMAEALFGVGSIAAEMCDSWIKANPYTPMDAIGIADATGSTAATGSIVIAGTATAPGTLAAYFGAVRVQVGVNVGDSAATVAANLFAAIELQTQSGTSPVVILDATYTTATETVALIAQNKGTLGNQVDIRLNAQSGDMLPPGITATITPMAGGATDPTTTIATVLSGISTWYTDIAFAWTDETNTTELIAWLTERYGAMVKLDVQGYVATSGTFGSLLTYQPNCPYLTVLPVQNPLTPSWRTAASMAAACCYSSANQPSLQMKTVPLPGIVAPAASDLFTQDEREVLLIGGFSTFYTDLTGTVYLERVVTSYRTDPGTGVQDFRFFDLQDTKVPTRVRYDWNAYIGQLYPRNNLTNDGTIAATYDPDAVTPSSLQASWTGRSMVYEQNGWIQNSAVTAKQSTFAIDPNDGNRVNSRQQIQVMGNLMVLAGSLEFISNN